MAKKKAAKRTTTQKRSRTTGPPAPPQGPPGAKDGEGGGGVGVVAHAVLMTTAEYGAHAGGDEGGVSARTVRNWIAEGMPHHKETYDGPRGPATRYKIDPAEADAWREEFHGLGIQGGTREGAGRPRSGGKSKSPPERRGIAMDDDSEEEGRASPPGTELWAMKGQELRKLLTIEKIRETRIKNDAAMGKLVPKHEVSEAFTTRVIRCRNEMAKIPESVSRVAASTLGLSATNRDRLRELLEQHIDAAVLMLGVPPPPPPPPPPSPPTDSDQPSSKAKPRPRARKKNTTKKRSRSKRS